MSRSAGEMIRAAAEGLAAAGVDTPLLDAQLMMARVLDCPRLYVVSHPEHELSSPQVEFFHEMLDRRAQRYPLAYLTGTKEFYGLEFVIRPDVLVPRPETELVVDEAVKRLRGRPARIAEVGAGSGAIGIAIAAGLPEAVVYATEISPAAAEVARLNVEKHQLSDRVSIGIGDLLGPVESVAPFDAVVSNPPYIPCGDLSSLQPEVRFEPREALDGGPDGLEIYRVLFPEAARLIRSGGFAAVEVGAGQAMAVREAAASAGFGNVKTVRDLAGIERVVVAVR